MSLNEVRAPIHKNRQTTMGKISGFYRDGLFRDIGWQNNKVWGEVLETELLQHFPIPGPHGSWQNYTKEDILNATYTDVQPGQRFGPTWTTHWFHVRFPQPPASWLGKEVHFRFSSGTEATVCDTDLNVLQGISPGYREEYKVSDSWTATDRREFYVEMACNDMFGAGAGDMIAPEDRNRFYGFGRVDLVIFNRENFNLRVDIDMLYQMADRLGDSHIGYQAMFVANEIVTTLQDSDSVANVTKCRALATAFFNQKTGEKSHTLHAMGHCHIDSAWLWPYDETIRKCARSFSAQMRLMEEYPQYKFVVSSAQQYEWVEKFYPDVFQEIHDKVLGGQFVPVGGTWIEMDGNIPNGEAFMRQYYYGQKYFQDKFGPQYISKEFWLPDTFGYSAQIPQMLKHVKIDRFLTQKMSWSLVNKFPSHNFWWEGIDGSQVLVHFPPGDSYNMNCNVSDFLNSQNNSLDKGRSNTGVFLYGNGDGGGGPTREFIERIIRVQNVDGMPKVLFSDSNTFFDALATEQDKFYKWVGELYLELHNGTYTSQARIKWYNRKCEFFFREVELLMAQAYSSGQASEAVIRADMLLVDVAWKDFLLNQFHDVLPGSCIEYVAIDAWEYYERVMTTLTDIRTRYNGLLIGTGTNRAIYNCLPWDVKGVVFMKPTAPEQPPTGPNVQTVQLETTPFEREEEGRYRVPSTFSAAIVNLRGSGYSQFIAEAPAVEVTFVPDGGTNWFGTFSNGQLTLEVEVDPVTRVPTERLFFDGVNKIPAFNDHLQKGISPGMLYYYDDVPLYWDAWDVMDYHLETRRIPPNLLTTQEVVNFGTGPIVGGYKWGVEFGAGEEKSTFTRYTIMRADSPLLEYYTIVDWKENRKLLKVEFPVDVLSRDATFEIQYGHAKRPTHMNTSWDMAKFEVCGHKWMDISQADKGISVITDSKYGWHVRDNHVQLSLLKSPKNPDGMADMHKHYIYYAVMPHKGSFQEADLIRKAYELNVLGSNNVPLLPTTMPNAQLPANFVTTTNPAVVVEAVKVSKPTDTTVDTICVRLYEAFGGSATTEIVITGTNVTRVMESNGLEEEVGPVVPVVGGRFSATFKPFQIQTFLVTFA
ncbi:alpha-mannosidase 2C1 isoform X2 [Folsomia candida]|uniref:alpha-mannosidase n=1 Tax=Folsomia candida TaxID=158441 RepID=A0A226F3X9_FOLCA|nr:alpha-mannosidase 2C1 isoform X2 [Folsomia candida]OXA64483.1 Alpha-mannosidase 2C1 [Folsomia candida]